MSNELELIAQITSTGNLRGKLIEAEGAKVEVEALLLKHVRFILFWPRFVSTQVHGFIAVSHKFCVCHFNCRILCYKKRAKNGNNAKKNSRKFGHGSKK